MVENTSDSDEKLRSLVEEASGLEETDPETNPTARTETVIEETTDVLLDGRALSVDEGLVKQSLPELLTALVVLRHGETHGKGVMDDIDEFLGVDLSPGTVYPVLHELEDEGPLSMHELVQTKEYSVDDDEATAEMLRRTMEQHLALGLIFQRGLESVSDSDEEDPTVGF